MKTIFLSFVILFQLSAIASIDPAAYQQAMGEALQAYGEAQSAEQLQEAANRFERISSVAIDEWLPGYYAASCYISLSYLLNDKGQRDLMLDKAEALLKAANEKQPSESEILTLMGWANQARIAVSPMSRGQKYSMIANEYLQKALALNPNNPRAHYLIGANLYYTPKMFGGGAKNALPHIENGIAALEHDQHDHPFWPSWGKEELEEMLATCKKELE